MTNYHLFTSESVSEGHPDKIADQISDSILDAILTEDPNGRVACETMIKAGLVFIAGEITTNTWINMDKIARNVIREVGYTSSEIGFDADSCAVITSINNQSSDIAIGVGNYEDHKIGAGDQGLVFGYATNETSSFMPAPITYAHKLVMRQAELRKKGILSWLRPDAKSQVTVRYINNKPVGIDTVVLSTQHHDDISCNDLTEAVIEEIIKPVLPEEWIDKNTKYLVNPTGRFVIGGPVADCGLTGRKIIVDTYGGMARHGGGCFSGKDPTKIDRSASYAARYIAKNIVAAGIAERCEIQISYAIGITEPVSISINTFDTSKMSDPEIIELINQQFDLTPYGIIKNLSLRNPIYYKTAAYGHFGRDNQDFSWEKVNNRLLS